MRFRCPAVVAWAVFGLAISLPVGAADASLRGRVADPDGLPLPGVVVTIVAGSQTRTVVSDANGLYSATLPPGQYHVKAALEGFEGVEQDAVVGAERETVLDLTLRLAVHQETVTVTAAAPKAVLGDPQPGAPETVTRDVVENGMLPNSQYDDALALLPNVVRAPDGSISVGGARAAQGALFVNGFNFTDPVTGEPGAILPLEAIDSVDVFSSGYSAELGRATSGVTAVHTKAGADQVHSSLTSFFPRMNYANGHVAGVRYWEPNAGISGPLVRGRLYYDEAISYRFDRNPIGTLAGDQDQKFHELSSWSQIDLQASAAQRLSLSFSANPQRTDHANMNAFTPAASAPEVERSAFNVSLGDRYTLGDHSTLDLRANFIRTRLSVAPGGADPYVVGHDLTTGSYFDRRDLTGGRSEASGEWSWTAPHAHFIRMGASFGRATLSGSDSGLPVTYVRSDGTVARSVTFHGGEWLAASANEVGAFVQDTWNVSASFTLDAGIRYDQTTAIGQTLSPRAAWTLKLPDGRSTISGSAGVFGDKLALEARTFPAMQSSVVQAYDPSGAATGPARVYANAIVGRLATPVAGRWDLSLDERVSRGWTARVKYQERRGRHEPVVEPLALSDSTGLLTLDSNGTSRSRSLETTVAFRTAGAGDEIYVSYVRSHAVGDLNSFDVIEGVLREPFVQPNQVGPLAADVPNRLLAWGLIHVPWHVTVAPYAEIRDGFPYSAIDENWVYVGARNSYRFPWFGSLDLYVNRIVPLPWHLPQARVGVKFWSLVSTHSERDIQRDILRSDFGATYNAVPRDFGGIFELLWGHK